MEEKSKRILYWDNIKGILIFLVVFGHCLYSIDGNSRAELAVRIIYTFHMPAFIFVSGFFGKSQRSQSGEGVAKLIFSYIIFNTVTGFVYGFENVLNPLYSYWYILALVMWRLTAKYASKLKFSLLIAVIIGLAAGFVPSIDNTLAFSRFLAFYPFYLAGYLFDPGKIHFRLKKIPAGIISLIAAGGLIAVAVNFSVGCSLMEAYSDPVYILARIILWAAAALMIAAFICLVPDKNIPLLTTLGRNSLCVFLFHRIFTLEISKLYADMPTVPLFLCALALSAAICFIFGNEPVNRLIARFLTDGGKLLRGEKHNIATSVICCAVVAGLVVSSLITTADDDSGGTAEDILYPVMTDEQEAEFDSAFRLVFAGDLILLEDQVKRGYDGENYDFTDVFEYAESYISSADYAIGVLEGPLAGEDAGYSTSNFDDGKELYLNYPDEFASAVKDAGFDLVTTSNNHYLDKGIDGAVRTLDTLDSLGLDHTGTYRSETEKENSRVKIVETQGIRLAVLSYTYSSNGYSAEELADGEYSYSTSIISGAEGELFEELKARVEADFAAAKQLDPDLIIVLPHIGTQFENVPDEEQEAWFSVFRENGADIILGDHSHAVQPVSITTENGKNVFEVYCPGNFANIYRENGGDTSALVEVYIDRTSKTVIGGGVIPLYTQCPADGNCRALPVYEMANNTELRATLSTDDIAKAEEVCETVTEKMLGVKLPLSSCSGSFLFTQDGYVRRKTCGLTITDEQKNGILWTSVSSVSSVCFLGDSVTEGTKNGGVPWYEPIEEYLGGKTVSNFSKGGSTVSYLLENIDGIPSSQLYVIATGTNDVRYRNEETCAMTADEYAARISALREALLEKSPGAKFIWIAPWYSTDGDTATTLSYKEKTALNSEYSAALEKFAASVNDGFININGRLEEIFSTEVTSRYLLDHIHPNATAGVRLYSTLVLDAK